MAKSLGETLIKARPMKPQSWEDGDVIHFEFSEGVVLTAFDPGESHGVAVLVTSATLPDGWIEETLRQIQRHVKVQKPGAVIKLIGTPAPMSTVSSALAGINLTPSTRHELGHGNHEVFFYSQTGRARVSKAELQAAESSTQPSGPIKVMIVDDSKTIRDLMTRILSSDPMVHVVATAESAEAAEPLIGQHRPHVITLDIHMPGMDGVTFLKKYLPQYPIPTVMISSISMEEGPMVLSALEAGAVEYIQKPSFDQLKALAPVIIEKIKSAAGAKVTVGGRSSAAGARNAISGMGEMDSSRVIAIGSSTGGTEALRVLMEGLPDKIPPIVIVQHIPPIFSKAFAMRMNDLFRFEVLEASDGDLVIPNRVLIAPGGKQMSLKRVKSDGTIRIVIDDSPPVNRHKPSVDVLLDSVVKELGKSAVGVILTGMGADGAKGLLKMRDAGSNTIAQDEASCVVFGMPREAIRLGGAETVAPLDQIASKLVRLLQGRSAKKAS
ncbi:chemotaxis response regulator protein-glutamate methylesterase [Bdellovibrionota bacterium FG-1]